MEINNFEKLVKIVTENIIGKISIDADPIINEKSCLILIPNIGLGFKDYFTYIRSNYPEYDLYLASNEESFNIHYIEKSKNIHFVKYDIKHSGFVNLLDAVETIIILGMKVNQMKALIETDDLEDVNHIILSSLMASKSINIMINANELIFNKLASIFGDIRNMGMYVTNIQQSHVPKLDKAELITESYVMNLKGSGLKTLVLDKKQLITPLAKDKLRELKIKIEYNEEVKL